MDEKNKKNTLKEDFPLNREDKNSDAEKSGRQEDMQELIKRYVTEAVNELKASYDKELEGRIASEREDAAKMATMSSEERAKAEIEKSRREFETERAQYISERAEFEAAKELTAQNLPVTFAKMVAGADREQTLENISAFKTEYLKAIEAGLSDRLKGTLPRISKEKEQHGDPFLNGFNM